MTRTTKRRTIIVSKHGHRHGKVTWSESVSRVAGFVSLKHEREVPCREIRIVSHRFQFFKKKVRKKSSRQPQVTVTIYTGPVVLPLSKKRLMVKVFDNTTDATGAKPNHDPRTEIRGGRPRLSTVVRLISRHQRTESRDTVTREPR